LLGLGLKFCPRPRETTRNIDSGVHRFTRSAKIKHFYGNNKPDPLFEPRTHVPSEWEPRDTQCNTAYINRISAFTRKMIQLHQRRRTSSNLLLHQRHLLRTIRQSDTLVICQADKNLGPCIVEKDRYKQDACTDHLDDTKTYKLLSEAEANQKIAIVKMLIQKLISKHRNIIDRIDLRFLRAGISKVKDPFNKLYLTYKVHKTPIKTRPVVSTSGALTHALGVWVDIQLQPLARKQPSYIKNSLDLKLELEALPPLPAHTRLFTSDATAMYTNIDTPHALNAIRRHITATEPKFLTLSPVMEALRIIMTNNIMQFGDTFWQQLSVTAMGTPPACVYATLYYACHEAYILDRFSESLLYYKRYIDDILGLWAPPAHIDTAVEWAAFKTEVNNFGTLTWNTEELTTSVVFLDLVLRIDTGRIVSTMHEKLMNLYLYISPHSSHPPGVLYGLIVGQLHRIFRLCSLQPEAILLAQKFIRRLVARGYNKRKLDELFRKALIYLKTPRTPQFLDPEDPHACELDMVDEHNDIYFHVPYHPNNPPADVIQRHWRHLAFSPLASLLSTSLLMTTTNALRTVVSSLPTPVRITLVIS
jgi:hypothetical protein